MSIAVELCIFRVRVLYLLTMGISIIYLAMHLSIELQYTNNIRRRELSLTSDEFGTNHSITEILFEIIYSLENYPMLDLTTKVRAKILHESGHVNESIKVCVEMGQYIKLLIVITSAPAHEKARMAIRHTWGFYATRKDVDIAFMMGSISDKQIHDNVIKEQYIYEDIIRGKFMDTYENLTLKTVSMLEWLATNCPKAAFILKTDDDMFINVPRLLTFVSKLKSNLRVMYGRLVKNWPPIRNKTSKYYISPQEYESSLFPNFLTGPAYLFPNKLSKELYLSSLEHIYFKLEDVFLTGIVASDLKIERIHVPNFMNKRISLKFSIAQQAVLTVHKIKSFEQYYIWKNILDTKDRKAAGCLLGVSNRSSIKQR